MTNLSSEEEIFFDLITLGLVSKLKNLDGIVALKVEKKLPCSRLTISAWEQNNGMTLPIDLKEFYASTDGFEMSWKFQNNNQLGVNKDVIGENSIICGEIKISSLSNVRPLNFLHKQKIKSQLVENRNRTFRSDLNIFENSCTQSNCFTKAFMLSHHENVGTICLVYQVEKEQNCHQISSSAHVTNVQSSIWLLDMGNTWHFLAKDLSTYFRMMLMHVGLNEWQLKFTSHGMTASGRRNAAFVVPHLSDQGCKNDPNGFEMVPNVINGNIFKISNTNSKNSKRPSPTKSKHKILRKERKN